MHPSEYLRQSLGRDNLALFVEFQRSKSPSTSIVIATTHLFWDPEQSDVKLTQACFLKHELRSFNAKEWPMALVGDFNSLPGSDCYKEFVKPIYQSPLLSSYSNYKLRASHAAHTCEGCCEPSFTNLNGVKAIVGADGSLVQKYHFAGTLVKDVANTDLFLTRLDKQDRGVYNCNPKP